MKNSVLHFLNNFSILLRHKREKFSFSQNDLSLKVGISLRTYQRIECGESEPSLSQVYKLAQILNFDVGEIFHFEQEMSEEQKLLRQSSFEIGELAKLSKVGSWNLDLVTGRCYWSKIIREILEVNDDFFPTIDSVWQFFKPGHSLELAQSSLNNCISDFQSFNIEVDQVTTKGDIRHCIIIGIPEICAGKVVRIYGVFQDCTNSKKLQTELRDALDKIADIQTFAGFGYWNLNVVTNKLYWSPSLYTMFGFEIGTANTINYETFLNTVHPEDRELVNDKYKESLVTKKPYSIEHRIVLPNGQIKWILERCKTEFDLEDRPIHSIGYSLDITNYK